MSIVYIGIGSNLGDRRVNIDRGIELLNQLKDTEVEKVSSLFETDPQGGPPQGRFLNGALEMVTSILPLELLRKLKWIEKRLGRKRTEACGPRPLDLDLLFYDDVVVKGKELEIPHPRLHQRIFVLRPLAEIAPEVVHPILNKNIARLFEEFRANSYGNN